ncbi:Ig-like domain repeat protein [Isosphaeraceae bacterium EP7]
MKDWMKSFAGRMGPVLSLKRAERPRRASGGRTIRLKVDGLERREVLSTATVTPFLSVPGQVGASGQTTSVSFQLAPGSVSAGKNASTVFLGFKARPAVSTSATPVVTGVVASGLVKGTLLGSTGNPFLTKVSVPRTGADNYAVTVAGVDPQAVDFALDSFLPGDVNGDLQVDPTDLQIIQSAYGAYLGDSKYNAVADINADGRVGALDKLYATKNLGAKATSVASAPTGAAGTAPVVVTPVTVTTVPPGTPANAIPVTLTPGSATTQTGTIVASGSSLSTNQLYYLVPAGTAQSTSRVGANVTMTQSAASTTFGSPVTFNVGVTSASSGTAVPTGTVTFAENGKTIALVKLVDGAGTFVASSLSAGNPTITATYSGDSLFTPQNSATANVVVNQDSTATKVEIGHYAEGLVLSARVDPGSASAAIPTGSVTVLLDGVVQGTATLSGGSYRWSVPIVNIAKGMSYTVLYLGDTNFTPSTSAPAVIG